jgi:hypothetical protein
MQLYRVYCATWQYFVYIKDDNVNSDDYGTLPELYQQTILNI